MPNRRPDAVIAEQVQQRLGRAGHGGRLRVQVHQGRVTVSGDVASAAHKADVLCMVAATDGVSQVDD